eukprot:scaffold392_cov350-Prasinococcus_capsulatus_cf.AAC.12
MSWRPSVHCLTLQCNNLAVVLLVFGERSPSQRAWRTALEAQSGGGWTPRTVCLSARGGKQQHAKGWELQSRWLLRVASHEQGI